MNEEAFYRRLRLTLDKIQIATGLPARTFIEMLGMSAKRYFSIRCGAEFPNILELKSLADALDLELGKIFSGDLDYTALANEFRGESGFLPARYAATEQMMGRARTLKNAYDFLVHARGPEYAWHVFRRLQVVPDAYFTGLDNFVSPLIIADLIDELAQDGMSEQDFRNLGAHSYVTNLGDLGKRLRLTRTPKRLYEVMIGAMPAHYDRMYLYTLQSLSDDRCVVRVTPRDEFVEVFKSKSVGTKDMCIYKQGVTASFAALVRPGFAEVHDTACVHDDDGYCEYHVHF